MQISIVGNVGSCFFVFKESVIWTLWTHYGQFKNNWSKAAFLFLFRNLAPTLPTMQPSHRVRLHAASSGATKVLILLFTHVQILLRHIGVTCIFLIYSMLFSDLCCSLIGWLKQQLCIYKYTWKCCDAAHTTTQTKTSKILKFRDRQLMHISESSNLDSNSGISGINLYVSICFVPSTCLSHICSWYYMHSSINMYSIDPKMKILNL